jgi:hypothetical protein
MYVGELGKVHMNAMTFYVRDLKQMRILVAQSSKRSDCISK